MEFDLENPLTVFPELESNTCPDHNELFIMESDYMPCAGNFDAFVRQQAITVILQLCRNLDPSISYLAVNYLDRFLSSQGIPRGEHWMLRLLATSCISLAAKMLKTDSSASIMFHHQRGEGRGLIFDQQTVRRMEALILGALNWRMRSITPLCFFDFFIRSIDIRDPSLIGSLRARASHIVFRSQFEISVLQFKPSIIAASALLLATQELLPSQLPHVRGAILDCSFVNNESWHSCFRSMQGIAMDSHPSTSASSTLTDENLLGRQCWPRSEPETTDQEGTSGM